MSNHLEQTRPKFSLPSLFLTDLSLPDGLFHEAMETNEHLQELKNVPTIVVSVKDDLKMMQECTAKWADDYLVKPFNNNALVHKCISLCSQANDISIHPSKMLVRRNEIESEELSAKEFQVISFLLEKEKAVQKEEIKQTIWGRAHSSNVLNTTLSRLRPKLHPLGVSLKVSESGLVEVINLKK